LRFKSLAAVDENLENAIVVARGSGLVFFIRLEFFHAVLLDNARLSAGGWVR
jgi:hypothetical protein